MASAHRNRTVFIDPSLIGPAPWLVRHSFHDSVIDNALSEQSPAQPVLVTTRTEDPASPIVAIAQYEFILAARRRGMDSLPVFPVRMEPDSVVKLSFSRAMSDYVDTSPIDIACAYQATIDHFGWTVTRLASVLGASRSAVSNYIRMLKLDDRVQQLVSMNLLSASSAIHLCSLPRDQQFSWANDAVKKGLSATDLFYRIRKSQGGHASLVTSEDMGNEARPSSKILDRIEDVLSERIGSPASIAALDESCSSGHILITAHSLSELAGIAENLLTRCTINRQAVKLTLPFSSSEQFNDLVEGFLSEE